MIHVNYTSLEGKRMQGSWKLIEDLRYVKHISKKKKKNTQENSKQNFELDGDCFFFLFFFCECKEF